jgi:ankyrin repeat protein
MATSQKHSEVSEFYAACRDGNFDFVKEYIKKNPSLKSSINEYESSVNDTPLHIASQNGHQHIVQLLIQNGSDRSHKNSHGRTAYEVAANDGIRQLFKRPADSSGILRFQDDGTGDCFDFVKRPEQNVSIHSNTNK